MRRETVTLVLALCAIIALCCIACMLLVDRRAEETPDAFEKAREYWGSRQPVTLTPEEQEKADWLDNAGHPVPIIACGMARGTFGQASKLCGWVVVGTVDEIEARAIEEAVLTKEAPLGAMVSGQRIHLSVDSCLYGKASGKTMTFMFADNELGVFPDSIEQREPKRGDRMLVFLADTWYDSSHILGKRFSPNNIFFFDFDRARFSQSKMNLTYIWSHIVLDDMETEEEAIRAAKGYLDVFGEKGKRDRDKYYEFLCSLLASPVKRIRDDAESDLVLFYTKEKDPAPDLDKLLIDGRVRKEVKDYLRYLLRDEKPGE
ncbi:MAG: hypothetical protein FWG50_10220 [Kiritimatiellaeota bacterium]|nr:hypothetical protein [Kiritimatiellota bacterium]